MDQWVLGISRIHSEPDVEIVLFGEAAALASFQKSLMDQLKQEHPETADPFQIIHVDPDYGALGNVIYQSDRLSRNYRADSVQCKECWHAASSISTKDIRVRTFQTTRLEFGEPLPDRKH